MVARLNNKQINPLIVHKEQFMYISHQSDDSYIYYVNSFLKMKLYFIAYLKFRKVVNCLTIINQILLHSLKNQ